MIIVIIVVVIVVAVAATAPATALAIVVIVVPVGAVAATAPAAALVVVVIVIVVIGAVAAPATAPTTALVVVIVVVVEPVAIAADAGIVVVIVAVADEIPAFVAHLDPGSGVVTGADRLDLLLEDRACGGVVDHFELAAVADCLDLDLGQAVLDLDPGVALGLELADDLIGDGLRLGRACQPEGQGGCQKKAVHGHGSFPYHACPVQVACRHQQAEASERILGRGLDRRP